MKRLFNICIVLFFSLLISLTLSSVAFATEETESEIENDFNEIQNSINESNDKIFLESATYNSPNSSITYSSSSSVSSPIQSNSLNLAISNSAISEQSASQKSNDTIVIKSSLKNVKTIKTTIRYQARVKSYSVIEARYHIFYYKLIGNYRHHYKDKDGFKKVKVFKKYIWKDISKKSSISSYKWYMQRYFKVYYRQGINTTEVWINGKLNKTTSHIQKYSVNGTSKLVKGKTRDLSKYVLPSTDCESDNPAIKRLAKKIIKGVKGKNTDTKIANAILKYVQLKKAYSLYGNTHKGAYGTLKSKKANCVDLTHLTIALLRAANIPARYESKYVSSHHGGHCWILAYLKVGKKYKWVGGESTSTSYKPFGTCTFVKKWQKYKADKGTYVNSCQYSKKDVYDSQIKQWVSLEEYHYINGIWYSYYVLSGNTGKTLKVIP